MMEAEHPVWSILRLFILMLSLVTILYLTASKFDGTEIRTILYMFLATAGTEGILRSWITKQKGD